MNELWADFARSTNWPSMPGNDDQTIPERFAAHPELTLDGFLSMHNDVLGMRETLNGERGLPYQPRGIRTAGSDAGCNRCRGHGHGSERITTDVPGMGSTVSSTMHEWTVTAENVYYAQMRGMVANELPGSPAVVAWIGYDAPEMPPSVEVLSSESARDGAPNLVSFLEGISSTRRWDPGDNLSVVAHSYGTTLASLALAQTPVEDFVMLGSAGIDSSIPDASYLQVEQGHVWASEAAGDWVADIGRGETFHSIVEGIPIAGTWASMLMSFDHPIDPTSADFGANVFSSETATIDGATLPGSTWHPAAPQVTVEITGKPEDDLGVSRSGHQPAPERRAPQYRCERRRHGAGTGRKYWGRWWRPVRALRSVGCAALLAVSLTGCWMIPQEVGPTMVPDDEVGYEAWQASDEDLYQTLVEVGGLISDGEWTVMDRSGARACSTEAGEPGAQSTIQLIGPGVADADRESVAQAVFAYFDGRGETMMRQDNDVSVSGWYPADGVDAAGRSFNVVIATSRSVVDGSCECVAGDANAINELRQAESD